MHRIHQQQIQMLFFFFFLATSQIKMNNEPINHLQKVLGRPESRGDVDLVKMEKEERRREWGDGNNAGKAVRFQWS